MICGKRSINILEGSMTSDFGLNYAYLVYNKTNVKCALFPKVHALCNKKLTGWPDLPTILSFIPGSY